MKINSVRNVINTRSIIAHLMTIVVSSPLFLLLDILIKRYYTFLYTGSTIVDVFYWMSVLFTVLLTMSISVNILFIMYYIRNKDYVVHSTYELRLYEKSILYLEIFTVAYPLTLWVMSLVVSAIIIMLKG